MFLYKDDFFLLKAEKDEVYIIVEKVGYDIRSFNDIMDQTPRVYIDNFFSLKKALDECSLMEIKIGTLKPEIEVFISSDNMLCKVKVNFTEEYIKENMEEIRQKIMLSLKENGIKYGIDEKVLQNDIISCEKFTVARGLEPVEGESAVIKYYTRSKKEIEINSDGNTDYYNLDLIDKVEENDWLGEKIIPAPGIEGYNIKEEVLEAPKGKDEFLLYDEKSIKLSIENEKIILRALYDGAVIFKNNKICVQDHLIIEEDVDFSTGNISFDGYVTIKGTVINGFNVTARNDISILGEIGMGTSINISSSNGSIFIKGGINGGGLTEIYAGHNVYTKYVNEATITAGKEINIGYYSIDSDLYADRVLINYLNGRIISGNINVRSQVVAGIIGNMTDRVTNINVYGFDRDELKKEYREILLEYKKMLVLVEASKVDLNNCLDELCHSEILLVYENLLSQASFLNKEKENLQGALRSKGEGEILVYKGIYPATRLKLKNVRRNIHSFKTGTFYSKNEAIFFEGYCKDC